MNEKTINLINPLYGFTVAQRVEKTVEKRFRMDEISDLQGVLKDVMFLYCGDLVLFLMEYFDKLLTCFILFAK
jgi:hypothetical protein